MTQGTSYDIGSGIASIRRVNPPRKEERQHGDRMVYQEQRLRGYCPKCKMITPTIQSVEHHESWALLRHWCKYCNKLLRNQRYPLTTIRQMEEKWEKEGMKSYARTN